MDRYFLLSVSSAMVAITFRTLLELGMMEVWAESLMLLFTIVAGIFWLEASFDIAKGNF